MLRSVLIIQLAFGVSVFAENARGRSDVPHLGGVAHLEVLDLKSAQRIALSENPSLEAARARVQQARALVQQAHSAFWPHIFA